MSAPLLEFTSHTIGKNAKVRVFPTHLELDAPKGKSAMAAVVTLGVSLAVPRKREVDTIPIKAITSVVTKSGLINSELVITTAGLVIGAKVSKAEAERIKSTLLRLMHEGPGAVVQPAPQVQQPSPQADHAQQIQQLAALRDQGILSPAEFDAKKAEILSRM